MLKYDDFMGKTSQDLPNSVNDFGNSDGSRNFSEVPPYPEKFSFQTDKIESIEWQDLEQRQRTGDCSVIHPPH